MKKSASKPLQIPSHLGDEILEFIFRDRMEHLGLMSSALVHELRTPLTIIQGRAQSLLQNVASNDQKGVQEIAVECQHLLSLLESMTFVTPETPVLEMKELDLKKAVDDVLIFFEKSCLEKGISLRAEVPRGLNVHSEINRLKSILMSLLNNAVESFDKSSPDQVKNILIHTHVEGRLLHLIISDTGAGMTVDVQNKILKNLFFSSKPGQTGSGLGLSLAQKMANDLKIALSFVTEVHRGTSFTLSFHLRSQFP